MKKLFALVLAVVMLLSVFAGCAQNDPTPSTDPKQPDSTQGQNTPATQATEPEKELAEITWVVRGSKQEDFDKVLAEANKLLEERYKLKLNLILVEDSEITQRVDLMVTSGEYFDLVYTNKATFYTNVNREAYLPLNELLETELGQKFMEVYPDGLEQIATIGGNVWALPNYQKLYTQAAALVRKDLAEKYNLDLTKTYKTVKDLEPFMDQVLEGEKDVWPLRFGGMIELGVSDYKRDELHTGIVAEFSDASNTVQLSMENEGVIDMMRTLNGYFKKGYIRADQATVTDDTADLQAGRYAICVENHKPGADVDFMAKYGGEYVMIDLGTPMLRYNDGVATMTAINVNSKHPDRALEMLYVMWTDPEIYNMLLFGLEGEHYTKVAEDRVELIPDAKYNMGGKLGWQLGNQFNAWKMAGQSDDIWEITEELNATALKSPLTGFVPDTSMLSTELALYAAADKEKGGYIYVDDIDAYVERAKKLYYDGSAQAIIDELQNQVDAWKAANGK